MLGDMISDDVGLLLSNLAAIPLELTDIQSRRVYVFESTF